MFHGLSHWDIAFALGVVFLNLLVDGLAVIALIGLMADERDDKTSHIDPERTALTSADSAPLGLLLERNRNG